MNDKNLYTRTLFNIGIIALLICCWFVWNNQSWTLVLMFSAMTIFVESIPIRMFSGLITSACTIGFIYMLIMSDFQSSLFLCLVSSLTFFIKESRPILHINWYRFFATLGMYCISDIAAWSILVLLRDVPLFIKVTMAFFIFENTNQIIRGGIYKSINGIPLFNKSSIKEIAHFQIPWLVWSLLLYRLTLQQDIRSLLNEILYVIGILMLINLFTNIYVKQINIIEENNQRYKSLFDQNPDIAFTLDTQGYFVSANSRFKPILGFDSEKVLNRNLFEYLKENNRTDIVEQIKLVLQGTPQEFSISISHKNGEMKDFSLTCTPTVVNNSVVGAYGIAKDVTSNKENERTIHKMAYYDTITGLPNRSSFYEKLHKAVQQAKETGELVAVMFLDMDQFKSVNDTLGHHMGDLLLVDIAKRIVDSVRKTSVVSRLGGDEFTIILTDLKEKEDCKRTAEEIIQGFKKPFFLQEHEIFITPSIGISVFPFDGSDVGELVKNADASMYQAKAAGGNTYKQYSWSIQETIEEKVKILSHLRRALERNEFTLFYQPKLDLSSGTICGVEALIRWESPELGTITPDKFIPLAEESRLILPIGEWVIRKACTQNKQWQATGFSPIPISVNLSSVQFQNDHLVHTIEQILGETGLDPEWLEFEITESLLLQNTKKNLTVLNELKRIGVSISIDDFGVGYSSLSYLKHFPIDYLKIDKSFVQNMSTVPKDTLIINAIINLAHSLKLKVIAEGVETLEQLDFLKTQTCDAIQGYLFSRPLREEDFTRDVWQLGRVYNQVSEKLSG